MAVTQNKPAPYAPTKAIMGIISRARNSSLPKQLTSDVLSRIGVTESLVPRTLQSLQILDLIDNDGTPTETLDLIRSAPEAEYQQRLEDWLKSAYADVFLYVDPSEEDDVKVRDQFRHYKPHGQQSRMAALFQGLCVEAGITTKTPRKRKPRVISAVGRSSGSSKVVGKASQRQPYSAGSHIPPPIAGLLQTLPPEGSSWSEDHRNKFVETFEIVLDFCIPIKENDEPDTEQSQ